MRTLFEHFRDEMAKAAEVEGDVDVGCRSDAEACPIAQFLQYRMKCDVIVSREGVAFYDDEASFEILSPDWIRWMVKHIDEDLELQGPTVYADDVLQLCKRWEQIEKETPSIWRKHL